MDPAQAQFVVADNFDPDGIKILPANLASISGKAIEGRNDYLEVTFAKNRIRIAAKIARVSDRADVALLKVDVPQTLTNKMELNDNYDTVKVGAPVTTLGYPQISPAVIASTMNKEAMSQRVAMKLVPDPTLSAGNVGRVIRGQVGLTEATYSTFGDVYQLTINSSGHGNSGGPVFDDQGKVIGIFTYGISNPFDAAISFAVPIRYGIELMGVSKGS